MDKKGFIIFESIITLVIILTSMLLLYKVYSRSITSEKSKIYYDDINYIYKTENIRKGFLSVVDDNKFYENVRNSSYYFYVFNSGSLVYNDLNYETSDRSFMDRLRSYYHYKVLVYININNVSSLKNCITKYSNSGKYIDGSSTQDDTNPAGEVPNKCKSSYTYMQNNYPELISYFRQFNPKEDNGNNEILITIINEKKDGSSDSESYDSCILAHYYKDTYGVSYSNALNYVNNSANKNELSTFKKGYNNSNLNYSMACESATYISWVYL